MNAEGQMPEVLPTNPNKRTQNKMYLHEGVRVYWQGKVLMCVHKVRRTTCEHVVCRSLNSHCRHELPMSSPCGECQRKV